MKELKGFKKLLLAPGGTGTATMELDARSLSCYDADLGTGSDADARSRNEMMYAMPLKSMVSFHVLTHDGMVEMIDRFNEAIRSGRRTQ